MKRLISMAAGLALAIGTVAPAFGQTVGPITRTFYGCAPGVSCHLVTLMYSFTPTGPVGTVRAQSWFDNEWGAGYPYRLIVSSFAFPVWGFNDEYYTRFSLMQPSFDESWPLDVIPDPRNPWRPQWVEMSTIYGLPAGEPGFGPYSERIRLTATPEPASMMLFATGLLAVGFIEMRRRKRIAQC